MKEKQRLLLQVLLQQEQPIASRILSEQLQLSVRTVKNYIAELNMLVDEPVIVSSNLGYTAITKNAQSLLYEGSLQQSLPQTYKERVFYIIKSILIQHRDLNIFDLSEELFVSYSTLKSDITKMNKSFENYHVRFVIKHDQILIMGEEKEKRRLISYVIFEEMPQQFMDQEILESNFNKQDVRILSTIIHHVLDNSSYHLNDFSHINLMLHLLILIESVRNGKSLVSRDWFSVWLREDKALLVTQIIQEIETQFDLTLNELEKEEIHMIFQANANYIPTNNLKEFEQAAGEDFIKKVTILLDDVHRTFGINLNSESFVVPFTLHLSGLFSRAKQASFLKNPMLDSLKKDFPIVYDLAIYMSLRLSDLLDIPVSEDESAYIALHVGSELEGQKRNFSKIRTVLLCPKYMRLDEKLYNQLSQYFGSQLNIIAVVAAFSETEDLDFDLLITTLPVIKNGAYSLIKISPFFSEEQQYILNTEIAAIRLALKKQILIHNFDHYFCEKFFLSSFNTGRKETVIKEMCQLLEAEDIVSADFYSHVLEREHASSTAFESVAIPHSVYMDATKTTICIGISREGILWDNRRVHIILLAAINELDRQLFTDIYEALISLFDNSEIYNELRCLSTFDEFNQLIHSKINLVQR